MDAYRIIGGQPLKGTIKISGSKNASLPCLFASLLTNETVELQGMPRLRDTVIAVKLLEYLGKKCVWKRESISIMEDASAQNAFKDQRAPYELIRQMRASVLVCGALLARWGKTKIALPGGCALGLRPIDIHLEGFKAMGALTSVEEGNVCLSVTGKGPKPVKFRLRFPSVGATENLMLAAALIPGETLLSNVAQEPEIVDLANMLREMGAKIHGAGTDKIKITGKAKLHGVSHRVIPDRLEAASFAIFAASVPGSCLRITHCEPRHLEDFLKSLKQSGLDITITKSSLFIKTPKAFRPRAVAIVTRPYPDFVTDLQPLWMSYMARARGRCLLKETIFENRFLAAAELSRMDAKITVRGDKAYVSGRESLHGAPVMASDIRAGIALVAAALSAKGTTTVSRIYHIGRGYENLEGKLKALGAKIERFKE